jgi:hypothetical protein
LVAEAAASDFGVERFPYFVSARGETSSGEADVNAMSITGALVAFGRGDIR